MQRAPSATPEAPLSTRFGGLGAAWQSRTRHAEIVELSHQLDGTLRAYRGDHLLLALPLPLEEHADRRPKLLTSAQKRKSTPRIYNLSGRPALAAVT